MENETASPFEPQGTPLVRVLYSSARDLYCVPAMQKIVWLSVTAYPLPVSSQSSSAEYLGAAMTADGHSYRRAFSMAWLSVIPGDQATLPANDPMVLDYEAYSELSLTHR